jgi:hypothetical protein
MELGQIVHDFAAGMEVADKRRPRASSSSTAGRFYQPGIGPFRETEAVALTLAELRTVRGGVYAHAGKRRYPASRNECDLALGELPDWTIEVKMARLRRDNGDYEDTTTKKILSPYPDDRSAVTDCRAAAGPRSLTLPAVRVGLPSNNSDARRKPPDGVPVACPIGR